GGASMGDDDWNDYDDEALAGDESPAATPARATKKKSGLFNILLIGGAVLFGGAFIMLKLGGSPAPAPQMAPADMSMTMSQGQEAPAPVEQAQAPVPRAPDAAFPADSPPVVPMAEPEEISNPTLPPMPATIEKAEDSGVGPAPTAEPAPVAAIPEPPPEAVPEQNMIDSSGAIRMPQAGDVLLKAPAPEAETVAAAPAAPAMNPEIAAKLDQVIARMDAFEKEIGDLRQAQAQVAEKTAATPPGLDADIASIKQSVAALEARIGALSAVAAKAPAEKPPAPAEKPSIVPPKVLGDGAEVAPEPAEPRAPVRASRPAAEPAVRWVLKGAQPGRAMVARAGEDDIQNVAVGDTLPGIGRITAIAYQDGKWVVEGTKGRISQ
ncbi:MAG: hypothetical protein HYU57_09085, partial [Micavibrio aeruginosavorus]|nr:hypothetical protein [Micavibrio aeruginosavorus]